MQKVEELLPGATLVAIVTAAAYGLRQVPGFSTFSPMSMSIFLGIIFANFTTVPQAALPGIGMFGKQLLRIAVALLGLQLTLGQVVEIGIGGIAVLAAVVIGTYAFTIAAGRRMGVDPGLSRLLAAGTSICGASAIAAANSVERGRDEEVAYAIACITLFGTVAMVLYPLVGELLSLDAIRYGFWTGASVHEVAQVVAAGYQNGEQAGEFSVVVKLSRVLLLAPLLLGMSFMLSRRSTGNGSLSATQIFPVFVAAFILAMLANSAGLVPTSIKEPFVQLTPVMLTAALGALGLGTKFGALRAKGLRPLLLAGLAALFISLASLMLLPIAQ